MEDNPSRNDVNNLKNVGLYFILLVIHAMGIVMTLILRTPGVSLVWGFLGGVGVLATAASMILVTRQDDGDYQVGMTCRLVAMYFAVVLLIAFIVNIIQWMFHW